MPTYQITSTYPYDFMGTLDKLIRFYLDPRLSFRVYVQFLSVAIVFTPKFQSQFRGLL